MSSWTVARAESFVLRIPRAEPVRSSYATYDAFYAVVVQLHTDDGAVGTGYTNVIGGGAHAIRSFTASEYLPLVVGHEPHEVRALWQRMWLTGMSRGRKGVAMYALSAVDIALWDLLAQQAGLPLHKLLGGSIDRVPVYGDGCWLSLSTDELVAHARRYADMGCFGVKVKVGRDIADDVQRVTAVREAVGPDMDVMIDANQRYDPMTALEVARRMEPLRIAWFEEPVVADSVHDQARVAARSPIPIAAGENEYSRYGFRELIEHQAVHILQPDVHRVGGVTEFLRIVALGDAWNMPVIPHTSHELHAQLVATFPAPRGCEYHDWFPKEVFQEDFSVVDGHVRVPDRPGIATAFAPEALTEYVMPEPS